MLFKRLRTLWWLSGQEFIVDKKTPILPFLRNRPATIVEPNDVFGHINL